MKKRATVISMAVATLLGTLIVAVVWAQGATCEEAQDIYYDANSIANEICNEGGVNFPFSRDDCRRAGDLVEGSSGFRVECE